jgi:hypothetical protein
MSNDWDAEAVAMASHVAGHMFEAHRGAMAWKQAGVSVVFGNDDYRDDRTRHEVQTLRGFLEAHEIPILALGVNPEDDHSWAMRVRSDAHEVLNVIVWACWSDDPDLDGFIHHQSRIAFAAIREHGTRPETSAN